ncbi:FCP1-like protein [Seiridium cupressi]
MSSQQFYRRETRSTRSGGPAFDPYAPAFIPAPNPATAWPGWQQPQVGQVFPVVNYGPANTGYGGHHAPQGMLGNYPVSGQPNQQFGTAAAGMQASAMRPSHGGPLSARPDGRINEAEIDSDTSSNPSVGEPLPQLTPGQITAVKIPILGRPAITKDNVKDKKPYIKPSKSSGGVPNPTKEYITQSSKSPSVLPVPRNILVIIDLNGTLLYRPNHKKTSTFVERPYSRNFLDYCLRTFTVAIWSTAKPENVGKMVPQILSPQDQNKLVAVWGRDTLGLSAGDYHQRVQCYKRLDSIWGDPKVAASHPEAQAGKRWDQTNTVLIDDSKEKARPQPYNIIQIPEFRGDTTEPGLILPQVHDYLNECAYQSDISSFIREKPFKVDPGFGLRGHN